MSLQEDTHKHFLRADAEDLLRLFMTPEKFSAWKAQDVQFKQRLVAMPTERIEAMID